MEQKFITWLMGIFVGINIPIVFPPTGNTEWAPYLLESQIVLSIIYLVWRD